MINYIIDDIWIGDWQDATRFSEKFSDIFTVAFDSKYKGNHFYPLVDGYAADNYTILLCAICDLIKIKDKHRKTIPVNNTLVHCVSGFSRSTTVVAGYIITMYGMSVEDALGYIKDRRSLANPAYELIKLLKEYEKYMRNE